MYKDKQKNGVTILFAVIFAVYFLLSAVEVPVIKINPEILLCLACVCPAFCSTKSSAVLCLVFGFLTDISVTPPQHFSPLVFLLCAFAMPKLLGFFSRVDAGVCAVCSLPLLLCRSVVGLAYLMNLHKGVGVWQLIKTLLLPELVLNVAGVIITYFICVALVKLFKVK